MTPPPPHSQFPLRVVAALLLVLTAMPSALAQDDYTDGPYAVLLEEHVTEEGRVDYAALAESPYQLETYLNELAELDRATFDAWPEDAQIALLINAYNAFTLKAIVDAYPIDGGWFSSWPYPRNSIRQIPGVWDEQTFTLMGEPVTLDYVEHEWLRVDYDEPRIHLAVNCASIGCPPLRREPYRGGILEKQLDEQTERFLSNPRFFRINPQLRIVKLSPIFYWYADDFRTYAPSAAADRDDAAERGVLAFISRYLDESTGASLRNERYLVSYLGYDWSLNETSR